MSLRENAAMALGHSRAGTKQDGTFTIEGQTPTAEQLEAIDAKASELEAEIPKTEERKWRDTELGRADLEIYKAEDIAGEFNAQGWRTYRKALRDWPEHVDFPDSTKRPVSP